MSLTRVVVAPRFRALGAVALALSALVLVVLTGTLGTARVTSPSMAPGYDVGTHLLTTRWATGDLVRGDVVVFDVPTSWRRAAADSGADLSSGRMVKRVVGIGGDHVVCCAPGGHLVVNGEVIEEPYLATPSEEMLNPTYDVVVPPGHLWLLGDNRRRSFDSRAIEVRSRGAGAVPLTAVRARVLGGF